MPSSISSSSQRLPHAKWREVLSGGLMALLAALLFIEIGLALRGIQPSLLDSPHVWQRERLSADAQGSRALSLVGSSRILLDADVPTLRRDTEEEPVQLAIEGGSFLPVLDGLAQDPRFRGTALVEIDMSSLAAEPKYDTAYQYEQEFVQSDMQQRLDYRQMEDYLDDELRSHLRSYADGTRPLSALLYRVLTKPATAQYVKTLPDREVLADYKLAPMPFIYFFRAMRTLNGSTDLPHGVTYGQIDAQIKTGVDALQPMDNSYFRGILPRVETMVDAITARGGRVIFVVFPMSGYVREIDEKRYPRKQFWDLFTTAVHAQTLDFRDDPLMSQFICPDGSHLDYRQRIAFTHILVNALHLGAKLH